jgi:hypothetical protein
LGDLTELKPTAPILNVKLSPKLFDLFQHCELHCNAGCCGWDAFDLSDRWLSRWCEFRDATTIAAARADIVRICDLLDGHNLDAKIDIHHFFAPTVATLAEHLDLIDNALATHAKPDDNIQA